MDLTSAKWRTSSYSGGNGGQCVQVAAIVSSASNSDGLCAVRDSKNLAGPALVFWGWQWRTFTTAIKVGPAGRPETASSRSHQTGAGSAISG